MNQNANGMSEIFCFLGFEFEWYFGKGCKGLPASALFIDPEVYKYYTKYSEWLSNIIKCLYEP